LHVLLYRAFGWEAEMPQFAHLSLLHDPRGRKLSKRNADECGIPIFAYNWFDVPSGNTWEGYADLGYLPESILSYIALLGWHPGGEEEIMDMDQLIAQFTLERCHHAPARFDMEKLNSFQEHYLRLRSDAELAALAKPYAELENVVVPSDEYLAGACKLMRERVRFARQILSDGRYLFEVPTYYDSTMVAKQWKGDAPVLLAGLADALEGLGEWDATTVHDAFHAFVQAKAVGLGKVMAPFRLALTGQPNGPGCFEMAELFGKEGTVARIRTAIEVLGPAV
jgi:glutamyl/glutaminyl-tRNA synthetase